MSFDYGTDLSCLDDLEEEGRMVTGEELLRQAFYRRLTTPRGSLLSDPDYGTDITEYVNEDIDDLALVRMRAEVRGELLKDERVVEVRIVSCEYDVETKTITLEIRVEVQDRELTLKLEVTEVTVELLTPTE